MGEIADDLINQFIDQLSAAPRRRRGSLQKGTGEGRWKTASGEILEMSGMTTEHLMNCIKFCNRTGNTGKLRELNAELQSRANDGPDQPKGTDT